LNVATSFFKLTNIRINPSKSILATINASTQPEVEFNGITIKATDHKESFRILGCYFTTGKHHKPILDTIFDEARTE